MKLPTLAEHRRFCEVDGWTLREPVKKHFVFRKTLPDGVVLRTSVSKGRGHYHSRELWERILQHQLHVTDEEFWATLRSGKPVQRRPAAPERPPGEPLPYSLVKRLVALGHDAAELRTLSRDEAQELLRAQGERGDAGPDG